MKVIYHKERPLLEFPDESWRPSLRMAVNRSAGANSLSVWLADLEAQQRTPLHWHDTEEVLVFLEVDGDGFARVGDQEYKIESQTSVVVPPGTIHAFAPPRWNSAKIRFDSPRRRRSPWTPSAYRRRGDFRDPGF